MILPYIPQEKWQHLENTCNYNWFAIFPAKFP